MRILLQIKSVSQFVCFWLKEILIEEAFAVVRKPECIGKWFLFLFGLSTLIISHLICDVNWLLIFRQENYFQIAFHSQTWVHQRGLFPAGHCHTDNKDPNTNNNHRGGHRHNHFQVDPLWESGETRFGLRSVCASSKRRCKGS